MPIALDANTKTLQIVLAGAKNTNDAGYVLSYERVPVATNTVGLPSGATVLVETQGTTNGVTAVTLMPAPGAGYVHRLKTFQLQNADLAAITATFQVVDTALTSTTAVCYKVTKQTLENLSYEDGLGWQNFDVNGATIAQAATTSANASAAGSQAVSVSVIASANLSTTTSQSTVASSALTSTGASSSTVISANLSTFTTASQTTSSQLSLQTSAGTSVTLSKTKSSFAF